MCGADLEAAAVHVVVLVVGVLGQAGVPVAARLPAVAPLRVGGQLLRPLRVRHTPAVINRFLNIEQVVSFP